MAFWLQPHLLFHLLVYLWAGTTAVLIAFLLEHGWRAMSWWQRAYVRTLILFFAISGILIAVVIFFPNAPTRGLVGHLLAMLALAWEVTIVLLKPLMVWGIAVGIVLGLAMYRERVGHARSGKAGRS